jgi:hypothetical protein
VSSGCENAASETAIEMGTAKVSIPVRLPILRY